MSVELKFQKIGGDVDHPNRCQHVLPARGQCLYIASEGSRFCEHHGAVVDRKKDEKTRVRNYRIQLYQERINEFADNDNVKSLREEVGILRMLMEEHLNRCKDSTDLLIYSDTIIELVAKIERVVYSCNKIENSLGNTLDKSTIISLATQIVNVITVYINDELIIDKISKSISEIFSNQLSTSDSDNDS